MTSHSYESNFTPPAPVLPLRVSLSHGEDGVLLQCLVDSGADITIVPEELPPILGLPMVDEALVQGFAGQVIAYPLYAARIAVSGYDAFVKVLAVGSEAILGRDVLNSLLLTLDGPAETLFCQ